ncbi:MAG: TetR/AcrR family transcriptional regulator [Balneolaceae bacterium]
MDKKELNLREKILETSRHLLFTEGHKSLSMRNIAKKVGVSATSIYLYFDNKDALIHTLIEESVEELSSSIEREVQDKVGCIAKFEATIQGYVNYALNNPEKYDIIYAVQPAAMSRYPKEKFRKVRRSYELLVDVIEEGKAEGLMALEDPVIAAYSIWAQLHGVVSVVLNQRLDSRINKDHFIQESLELIIHGFLVKTTVS